MGLSFWQILLVVVLFLLLFGRGKIPQLMGDIAEGIKSFRDGMSKNSPEETTAPSPEALRLPETPDNARHNSSTSTQVADRV